MTHLLYGRKAPWEKNVRVICGDHVGVDDVVSLFDDFDDDDLCIGCHRELLMFRVMGVGYAKEWSGEQSKNGFPQGAP